MKLEITRGLMVYSGGRPERRGVERGREAFVITRNDRGQRTLRSFVQVVDEGEVERDVTLTLNPDWTPAHAFVRMTVKQAYEASGWFHFTDHDVHCEAWNTTEGRRSLRLDLDGPAQAFSAHNVMAEGWVLRAYDRAADPTITQFPKGVVVSSTHNRGATGPEPALAKFGVRFLGTEQVTVPAGRFECWHFQIVETSLVALTDDHPAFSQWVTTDGEYLLVKAALRGAMESDYELATLTHETVVSR